MKKPEKGQKMYVPSSCFVYRGEDDIHGGIATISKIKYSNHLPEDHFNYIMVGFEEIPVSMYNYKNLMKEQGELEDRFGIMVAHPDPDTRKEFNQPDVDWKN